MFGIVFIVGALVAWAYASRMAKGEIRARVDDPKRFLLLFRMGALLLLVMGMVLLIGSYLFE